MKKLTQKYTKRRQLAGVTFSAILGVALAACPATYAQSVNGHPIEDSQVFNGTGWLIGLGALVETSPFKDGEKQEIIPFPYIAYDWNRAHLGIDGFSYDIFESEDSNLSVTTHIQPRFSFTAPEGSEFYKESDDDTAIDAGVSAEMDLLGLTLGAEYFGDISSTHKGWEAEASISTQFPIGRAGIEIGAGFEYQDRKLTEFIYAPLVREAASRDENFDSRGKWQPFAEITLAYPIGDKTALVAFADYRPLRNSVRKNALIDEDATADFGAVLVRRF